MPAKKNVTVKEEALGISEWFSCICNHDVDLLNREIYLTEAPSKDEEGGGVDHNATNSFIKNLRACEWEATQSPILIHMNLPGGDLDQTFAIYDAVDLSSLWSTVLVYGRAESGSSIILQAANHRVMMPNAHMMIHNMWIGQQGDVQSAVGYVDFCKAIQGRIYDIYAEKMKNTDGSKWCRRSIQHIKDMLLAEVAEKREVWLTADEAVRWGLADEVFDGDWIGLRGADYDLKGTK